MSSWLLSSYLEGETVLMLAGFAAHRDYLELPLVIVSAFIGSAGYLIGDALTTLLGEIKHIEQSVFAAILVMGFSIWLIHLIRRYRAAHKRLSIKP